MATELENRIEAILFASGKGVSEDDLAEYCETKVKNVQQALLALKQRFEASEGSLVIDQNGNKWKLTVRGKYLSDVQQIVSETELPSPMLKTLAVIAFKSPVLQSEVINIRGQGAYEHVRELVKEKFITKDEEGRSYLLKITDKFYNYFDVEGDQEIREVFEKLRKNQKTIGDLEVVDAESDEQKDKEKTKEKEPQQKLGDLEIVESDPNTKKEEPIIHRKEKTQEEKDEEDAFLKKIDEGINELSSRIKNNKLPKRQTREEQDQEYNEEEKETNNETSDYQTDQEEETDNDEEKKTDQTPIEEIEAFVEEHEKKSQGKENYL